MRSDKLKSYKKGYTMDALESNRRFKEEYCPRKKVGDKRSDRKAKRKEVIIKQTSVTSNL